MVRRLGGVRLDAVGRAPQLQAGSPKRVPCSPSWAGRGAPGERVTGLSCADERVFSFLGRGTSVDHRHNAGMHPRHRRVLGLLPLLLASCQARPCPPNAVFLFSAPRNISVCAWYVVTNGSAAPSRPARKQTCMPATPSLLHAMARAKAPLCFFTRHCSHVIDAPRVRCPMPQRRTTGKKERKKEEAQQQRGRSCLPLPSTGSLSPVLSTPTPPSPVRYNLIQPTDAHVRRLRLHLRNGRDAKLWAGVARVRRQSPGDGLCSSRATFEVPRRR